MSYPIYKSLVICIICNIYGSTHKRISKEEESVKVLAILGLAKNK